MYICEMCAEIFTAASDSKAANEEADAKFSAEEQSDGMSVICDDCYQLYMREHRGDQAT